MSVFESTAIINRPVQEVYLFLADMNNHKQLMPDNITDWASTADAATFNIQNITTLSLKIEERIADHEIRITPAEKPPFDIELKWLLNNEDGRTRVLFYITAQLSTMMKMLASAPLQKLTDQQTANLTLLLN